MHPTTVARPETGVTACSVDRQYGQIGVVGNRCAWQPVQRNTRYDALRVFDGDPALEVPEPLDLVEDASAVFGDYKTLTADPRFHYEPRNQRRLQVIDA